MTINNIKYDRCKDNGAYIRTKIEVIYIYIYIPSIKLKYNKREGGRGEEKMRKLNIYIRT